jgi:antitoxin (DNA-binding transcriptional repressor) of toxin-antitoxin stability system
MNSQENYNICTGLPKRIRMETVTAEDAKSHLPELLTRASAGERFVIQRQDQSVAVLLGVDELERLERASNSSIRLAEALGQDPELLAAIERGESHPAMAGFGFWRDNEEFDDFVERVAANRARQSTRLPVDL